MKNGKKKAAHRRGLRFLAKRGGSSIRSSISVR
jgi:hypothetical protein